MPEARKPIERAVAKIELERINSILPRPHLLIGGLAVQQYYSARVSQDIDLVCDFEVAQTILRKLYPSKDWKVEDSKNDEYRPSYRIHHKVEDVGTIIFGPKISEREPYRHLDWRKLEAVAKPFKGLKNDLENILVPAAHALAYAKMISFLCRQSPDSKVAADLQDFCDLTNHEDFSVTLFYDLLRQSRAADELITNFRKKVSSFPKIAEASCLHSISELYHASTPKLDIASGRSQKCRIYLAAPHRNIAKNNKLKAALLRAGFLIKLPYDEVATNGFKKGITDPIRIRDICISAIDISEIILVDLDTYGLDTAWEIGYAEGMKKRIIGYNEDIFLTTDNRHINRRSYRENFMHGWASWQVCNELEEVLNVIRGRTVYMCGSFSNSLTDKETKDALAKSATNVIYPKDHLVQQQALPRDYPLSDRGETNRLLEQCDTLLVTLPRYGMDSSWQIGYATALKKMIIGWMREDDERESEKGSFWDHWMHGWKSKPHVVGITDLIAFATGIAAQMKKNG
jgi:nucleoside 2-deoxyribosyltransferase